MVAFIKKLLGEAKRALLEVAALVRIAECERCKKIALVITADHPSGRVTKLCAPCFREVAP